MEEPASSQDFSSIYDRYFTRIYSYIRGHIGNAAEADDITSRVFERVLERLGSYRAERGSFEAWLFAVARNAVRDRLRSWHWRSFFSLDAAPQQEKFEPGEDDRLCADEDHRRLASALQGLDERSRDILGLKFQGGLTNRQICEVLGLGESHVGVLVYRAVKKLQSALGDETA